MESCQKRGWAPDFFLTPWCAGADFSGLFVAEKLTQSFDSAHLNEHHE